MFSEVGHNVKSAAARIRYPGAGYGEERSQAAKTPLISVPILSIQPFACLFHLDNDLAFCAACFDVGHGLVG
jgi:hypothetical protein